MISTKEEMLRLSLGNVDELEEDGCKQGTNESRASAHGGINRAHLTKMAFWGLGQDTAARQLAI